VNAHGKQFEHFLLNLSSFVSISDIILLILFLPPETPASDTKPCQSRRHGAGRHVTSHLTSRLLPFLPAASLAPLQRVQNATVWLVFNLDRQSHI